MRRNHVVTLSSFLIGLAAIGASYHSWQEMLDVRFFFGVVGLAGAVLNAAYTDSPAPTNVASRAAETVAHTLSGTGNGE